MLTFAVAHIAVDQVARELAVQDSGWAIFAAVAAALAAIATLVLAFFTSQSVKTTRDILANENLNFRKATTIRLIERWFSEPQPVYAGLSLTPQNAVSEILIWGASPAKLKQLKYAVSQPITSEGDKLRHKRYLTLTESFGVVLNFFMIAAQLFWQEALDNRLFFNTFAKTFLSLWDAMHEANAVVEAVEQERIARLSKFKEACEEWLKLHGPDQAI
jgi:hypothetical protein